MVTVAMVSELSLPLHFHLRVNLDLSVVLKKDIAREVKSISIVKVCKCKGCKMHQQRLASAHRWLAWLAKCYQCKASRAPGGSPVACSTQIQKEPKNSSLGVTDCWARELHWIINSYKINMQRQLTWLHSVCGLSYCTFTIIVLHIRVKSPTPWSELTIIILKYYIYYTNIKVVANIETAKGLHNLGWPLVSRTCTISMVLILEMSRSNFWFP